MNEYYKKSGRKPYIWLSFIDDVFFIWTEGEESLKDFISFTQNYSQTKNMKSNIKFEVHQSVDMVNFLDVSVMMKDGNISTTVYSMPTDSHLYLTTGSNHPSHIIRNIPKSQFLRLRRICSDTADFVHQCNNYVRQSSTKLLETI